MENVTHNTLPPMDYARDTVNAWLTEFPVALRLLTSLPSLGDDCKVELQEDLSRQKHSLSIKNLQRLTRYHRLASEISASAVEKKTEENVRNFYYVGTLLTHEKDPSKLSALARFLGSSSTSALRSEVATRDSMALFFKLEDFMHVPDSQAHPSGNWFAVHKSGQALIRPHQSFLNCENFWALKRERRLARQDTGELQWRLEDFQRNAKGTA